MRQKLVVSVFITTIFTIQIVTATGTDNATLTSPANVFDVNDTHSTWNATLVKDLHVIGLFPYSGIWHGGESMQTAIQIGMDQVNSMEVIPVYRLRMTAYDTKVWHNQV